MEYDLDLKVLNKFKNNTYLPIIEFVFKSKRNWKKYNDIIFELFQFLLHKWNMKYLTTFIFSKIFEKKDI